MLKPIDAGSTVEAVWHQDPAVLEMSEEEQAAYIQAAFDNPSSWRDHLKLKDGEKVTKFVIGVIPSNTLNRLEDASNGKYITSNELAWGCFIHGLRDIVDGPTLETTLEDGRKEHVVPKVNVDGIEYVKPGWANKVMSKENRNCGLFIGRVAYYWNMMKGDDAGN